jgi:hypothetical protein
MDFDALAKWEVRLDFAHLPFPHEHRSVEDKSHARLLLARAAALLADRNDDHQHNIVTPTSVQLVRELQFAIGDERTAHHVA